jgi:hypothetical protein
MEKKFTYAGISSLNGVVAYRFANDAGRVKVLAKNGHEAIDLRSLPEAMTKEAATLWLNQQGITASATRVTKDAQTKVSVKLPSKPVKEADTVDDDGFVEPTDERIQVAMCQLARLNPGLSAANLYKQVMMTHKEFGDYEPSF